MDKVLQKIEQYKIVPVVTIQKIGDAAEMLEGLVKGSLPVAEICFRTDCAEEAIKLAIKKYPEMLVGAGTVSYTHLDVYKRQTGYSARNPHRNSGGYSGVPSGALSQDRTYAVHTFGLR